MKRGARYWLGARAARIALDALYGTVRFEVQGLDRSPAVPAGERPVIYVLWHGRLLPLAYLHRRQGIVTLISRSADGEYIARIVESWGYVAVRGSSSRRASAALRELVRYARAGRTLALTPDGPRGPRQELKAGALVAAQLSGLPLVPLAAGTDRAWWIEGWDRFLVPKPFARIRVIYGEPQPVARDADAAELERQRGRLEDELNRLTREVDGDAGGR